MNWKDGYNRDLLNFRLVKVVFNFFYIGKKENNINRISRERDSKWSFSAVIK